MKRARLLWGLFGLAALLLVAFATAVRPARAAFPPRDGDPPPRVTLIADSVGGVLLWADARDEVAQGLDFRIEAKACRKLVAPGCFAYGGISPSALETIRTLGTELGPLVVVDVGYSDRPVEYEAALDTVMQALLDAQVVRVVWLTLEENEDVWAENNAIIRDAPRRWPQLIVAEWAPVAAANPSWFGDIPHMNPEGALGFAGFLRPVILSALKACGPPCT